MFGKVEEVLLESVGGKVLLGVGAILVAPVALPVLRPITKQVVKGGLVVADKVKEYTAETGERWSDLVAEAKSEMEIGATTQSATVAAPATSATMTDLTQPQNGAEEIATAPADTVDQPPWHHLEQIPEFGPETAELAWESGYHSFADIQVAAENDKLRRLPGIGKARQASVLEWVREQSAR